jgi:hypothetical protein
LIVDALIALTRLIALSSPFISNLKLQATIFFLLRIRLALLVADDDSCASLRRTVNVKLAGSVDPDIDGVSV